MKPSHYTAALIGVSLTVYILIIGQSLIVPLVIAFVFFYLIILLSHAYERIKIKGWKMYRWLAIVLSILTFMFVIFQFIGFVQNSIDEFRKTDFDRYRPKIQAIDRLVSSVTDRVEETSGIDVPHLTEIFESINFSAIGTRLLAGLTAFAGNLGLIFIYIIFLFLEYKVFFDKLTIIFPKRKRQSRIFKVIDRITKDVNTYVKMKTLISLITAVLSYLVMVFIGVDLAGFWALLIFVLNFIPNIGSIIAVIFPVLMSILQFEAAYTFLFVLIFLAAIQLTMGNFIEPRLMGKTLNLSPLLIIISLTVWYAIWGIVGMFLCVPIMVITNIVLANFDRTRPIAVFMSQNGRV